MAGNCHPYRDPYVDNRDVAQGTELALRYDVRGKDKFFITNDETVMRTPSSELLDRHYPNIERRKQISGNEVLLSNEKAKRVLGFKPVYSWVREVSQA
ncbi:NAD(P)-dependent oxidoreductase [Pseudomonas chlororaphis]|nr:NAD(P)-dependent oxidoreductase [Pseudomonas chlororaphis]WDH19980.1 NAD(P)-dependent oxidoreductase [Pseudomonas chlororaphis]